MNQRFHIVLVEDDPAQEKDLKNELETVWRNVCRRERDIIVETLTCEAEFLDRFEAAPEKMPDMFVLDLMLEWRQPWVKLKREREFPSPPPEMDEAGIRCLKLIRKHSGKTPVLIWTMTNKQLPPRIMDKCTFYLRKDRAVDGDLADVFRRAKF